jgi:hypothetical protein
MPAKITDDRHFPALRLIFPFSDRVIEHLSIAQTAATPSSDKTLDFLGADRKGFPTKPS